MKRHLWLSICFVSLIIMLSAAGIMILVKSDKEGSARVQEPVRRVNVTVQTLTPRPFTKMVEAYAVVSPYRKGTVSAQVAGPIDRINQAMDPGNPVVAGQELAYIEDTRLGITLQKAQAVLEKSKALLRIEQNENEKRVALFRSAQQRLDLAISDYERKKVLFEKKLIAAQTLELAESQVELHRSEFETARSQLENRQAYIQSIQADIASAEAEIRKIQEDLADTVVRAPFDGIIAERKIELGDQVSFGQHLFTILDISMVKVLAQVPSEHVGKIHPGTAAEITTRAYLDNHFEGWVTQVHPEADPHNRTFSVEVQVENKENPLLLPGMFARVRIPILRVPQALIVPRDAILEDENGPYLYLADTASRIARRQDIVIGDLGPEDALVQQGVLPGEALIIRGQELLDDGAPIQLQSTSVSETNVDQMD